MLLHQLWTTNFPTSYYLREKYVFILFKPHFYYIFLLLEVKNSWYRIQTTLKCSQRTPSLDSLTVPLSLDLVVTWDLPGVSMHPYLPHWCLGKARTSPLGILGSYFLDSQGWTPFLLLLLFSSCILWKALALPGDLLLLLNPSLPPPPQFSLCPC